MEEEYNEGKWGRSGAAVPLEISAVLGSNFSKYFKMFVKIKVELWSVSFLCSVLNYKVHRL